MKLDPLRHEAHILAAAALRDQQQFAQAATHLRTASSLAPDNARHDILRAITELRIAALPADARRKLDALMLVMDEANKASGAERTKLLREFMVRSNTFLEDYSFVADLWLLRAAASLELDYPETAWIAVHKLTELGLADSNDPATRDLMARLERKQWLDGAPTEKHCFGIVGINLEQVKAHASEIRAAAEAGDAYCQSFIANFFNDDQRLKWARAAADQGLASAARQVALEYEFGIEVPENPTQAIRWMRKAADLGDSDAKASLGAIYSDGRDGIPVDLVEGVRWYRKAAAQNNSSAEEGLGDLYMNGKGVPRDASEAVRWYRKAADHRKNNFWPAWKLGLAYHHGDGVTPDDAESVRWFRIAEQELQPEGKYIRARGLATDPDPHQRYGAEAVRLAIAACEQTKYEDEEAIDALAAAYAETGDWDKAVATEQQAMDLLRKAERKWAEKNSMPDFEKRLTEYQARLNLYRNKQPYRFTPR